MQAIYLFPKSPFPLTIPSNTLFGALCYGVRELYGEKDVNEIVDKGKPPFLISSAFPFVEDEKKMEHFFPKLITKPPKISTKLFENAKKLKAVNFVHESIFSEWINGKTSELELIEKVDDAYKVEKGLLIPKKLDLKFDMHIVDLTQNILNRLTSQSEDFFYITKKIFSNSGLFFLIKYHEEYEEKIISGLRFLEDRGIGGDISIGKGEFKFSKKELKIEEPIDGKSFLTLSRYCPGNEINEFDKGKMWYELEKIQGRCRDGIIKKAMFIFKEGSTFPDLGKEFYGKIENVRKDPRMVEFGYAFPIKMRESNG